MPAVREITDWNSRYNHTYLLDGSRAVAYIPSGTVIVKYFDRPIPFDKKGRKFEEVRPNPFSVIKKSTTVKVKGSKGNFYEVDLNAQTCSCVGYTYHGTCRHLKELMP